MSGTNLNQISLLKTTISELKSQIESIGFPPSPSSELISSANIIRENEFLKKSDVFKTQLIEAYSLYVEILEEIAQDAFEIQKGLTEILKTEILSLEKTPTKKSNKKIKAKPTKKTRKKSS